MARGGFGAAAGRGVRGHAAEGLIFRYAQCVTVNPTSGRIYRYVTLAYLSLRNYNYSMPTRNGVRNMIDALDTQTQALPLEKPAKRGRPATGKALSNAERQRAYRERQKAQRNDKEQEERKVGRYAQVIREQAEQIREMTKKLELAEAKCDAMGNELAKEKARKPRVTRNAKGLDYAMLTKTAKDLIDDMNSKKYGPDGDKWSFGVYMLWNTFSAVHVEKKAYEQDKNTMRKMAGLKDE